MNANRDIWVWIETFAGEPLPGSLELLDAASRIQAKTAGKITAILFGGHPDAAVTAASEYGADEILVVPAPELERYSAAAYASALEQMVRESSPAVLMISATSNGKDFASLLACRLKTGITANCIALDADADTGLISWMMPAPGGVMASIRCEKTRPQMATVCPGIFLGGRRQTGRTVPVRFAQVSVPEFAGCRLLSVAQSLADSAAGIERAEIVVAGGRGAGEKGFAMLRELALLLGGQVGASRAAVDAGWIEEEHQIGQTGKAISPKLYIACGISGALQHVSGISGAECVVAINSDPEAPIFEVSDYGIVGDVLEILPNLIREVQQEKGRFRDA